MQTDQGNRSGSTAGRKNTAMIGIFVLCATIVAAGGIFLLSGNGEEDSAPYPETGKEESTRKQAGVSVGSHVPVVDSRERESSEQPAPSGEIPPFATPVAGAPILKEFSVDQLLYSKTLDQFEIHPGIDYEADEDTPVTAAGDGTVTKVENDDKYGLTIEIAHGDGYVTRYSNLSTDKMTEVGDVVRRGDVISGVGRTALFENLDPAHLHFEVWKDGAPMDPLPLLE